MIVVIKNLHISCRVNVCCVSGGKCSKISRRVSLSYRAYKMLRGLKRLNSILLCLWNWNLERIYWPYQKIFYRDNGKVCLQNYLTFISRFMFCLTVQLPFNKWHHFELNRRKRSWINTIACAINTNSAFLTEYTVILTVRPFYSPLSAVQLKHGHAWEVMMHSIYIMHAYIWTLPVHLKAKLQTGNICKN